MKIAIIGAGPAGLMAASTIKGADEIAVFDSNEKAGKKLYLTGKGRCNVSNDCLAEEFLENVVSNKRFLYSALKALSPQDTIVFLEKYGTPLKIERGKRVFPKSDKASDITKALLKAAAENNVKFEFNSKVKSIEKIDNEFKITAETAICRSHFFNKIILATGGKSYPATGSDGNMFKIVQKMGHTIIPFKSALVPIILHDNIKPLEGLSLKNIKATVKTCQSSDDVFKFEHSFFGEMLFTSNGVSGPIILSLSSFINKYDLSNTGLYIDLKPALTHEQLDIRILSDFEKNKNKQIKNTLDKLMPKALIDFCLEQSSLSRYREINGITKAERTTLVKTIKGLKFSIKELAPLECGIVTAGGVDTKEINSKTMESKLIPNLYFAGEMIDIDALTGGYNIQIALSTGYLAGKNSGT